MKLWDQANRMPVLLVSAGMIAAIALADWRTTPYVSLGFLYLFPIMLASGFLPRPALGSICAACAVLSELFSALDPDGRPVRLVFETLAFAGCGMFVSELIRNRKLSLETQERLRALVETSPAAIVTLDDTGRVELANRAAVDLFDPGANDILGLKIGAFLPDLESALEFPRDMPLRASMQCQMQRRDGEMRTAEVQFSTYVEGGRTRLAAIIGDVTEEQVQAVRAPVAARDTGRPSLNSRQVAVLRLLFEGRSNNQIASSLEMTPSAVKNTLQQLFAKAGVNNRSQLVRVALEQYRDLL